MMPVFHEVSRAERPSQQYPQFPVLETGDHWRRLPALGEGDGRGAALSGGEHAATRGDAAVDVRVRGERLTNVAGNSCRSWVCGVFPSAFPKMIKHPQPPLTRGRHISLSYNENWAGR